MRRLLIGTLGLAGAAALTGLAGCNVIERQSFTDSRTDAAAITEVRIEGGGGRVTLEHSGSAVQIDRLVHYADKKPGGRFDRVEKGVLYLNTTCAKRGCDIDYTVRVPDRVRVTGHLDSGRIDVTDVTTATLSTSSGRIVLDGVAGDVTATSDSGRIDAGRVTGSLTMKSESGALYASHIGGPVVARTSSGSVHGDGLGGNQTTVHTSSGSVSLAVAGPQDVKVETDSGRIQVTVPGGGSWKVKHTTDSGRVEINVPESASAAHLIDVSSSSGRIEVKEGPATAAPNPPSPSNS